MSNSRQLVLGTAMVALLLAVSSAARGQGRGFSEVSGPRGVGGESFGNQNFLNYSYGLSFNRNAASTGTLDNSQSSFGLVRRAGDANESAGSPQLPPVGSQVRYVPEGINIPVLDQDTGFNLTLNKPKDATKTASPTGMTMSVAFGFGDATKIDLQQPLTSFAPATPGRYTQLILDGEEAMHSGKYDVAIEKFLQTNCVASRSPESLLSLAHAYYASGDYALMAHFVRLAITYHPNLALSKIRIRAFFRDSSEFISAREGLRARAQLDGQASFWLAMAYVLWFDEMPDQAADALQRAAQLSEDPVETEAIRSFWDGCVSTGRISGKLSASQPSQAAVPAILPTTMPAGAVN